MDCSGVIIKLNSVQLQLQLPAGTEIGKTALYIMRLSFRGNCMQKPICFLHFQDKIEGVKAKLAL